MTESVKLTTRFIWTQVYHWGMEHRKLPVFKNMRDEIEHYHKPISQFSKRERKAYEDAMEELEKFFEQFPIVRDSI